LIGPKGIPKPVVQKLEDGFRKAMDDAEFQTVMKKFDFPPAYLGSQDYENLAREDSDKIQKLVKKLGLDKKH
jgi:tripartite-type tricarboxylate transporter receptor subunit TctC